MAGAGQVPYQVFRHDPTNMFPGVMLLFLLAFIKDSKYLPPLTKWQLNAYTNWNLLLIALGQVLGQRQWDPFLCVNSFGILIGFRTGFSQGLTENLRRKIREHGLDMSRSLFTTGDHIAHTLPACFFLYRLVSTRRRIPNVTVMYGAILATWAAFRQQAKLDASDLYVPHPWRRAWLGIICGMSLAPGLVEALISRSRPRIALMVLALFAPWCTTKLDPHLRQKYMFEYAVSCVGKPEDLQLKRRTGREQLHCEKGLPVSHIRRVQSDMYAALPRAAHE